MYWAVSAIGVKEGAAHVVWRREIIVRLILIVAIVILFRIPATRHLFLSPRAFEPHSALLGPVGAALCIAGIGLAIWARLSIGKDWGLPMSRKTHPDLVTTGPYAYVRHPIYAGIILAAIGSAIAVSVVWVLPLLIFLPYFIYSARIEEQTMTEQFPDEYPAYRARTKMFVPFML